MKHKFQKGNKWIFKRGHKINLGKKNSLGSHRSVESRKKLSEKYRGEKSWNWRGGTRDKNQLIRQGIETRLWREAVFSRDGWTCQECGKRGGILNAHHIKSFAYFPELRFSIDNGRTLCKKCHTGAHKKCSRFSRL
jgi:5-methylcytosine-specific restriction endonuclease McrA